LSKEKDNEIIQLEKLVFRYKDEVNDLKKKNKSLSDKIEKLWNDLNDVLGAEQGCDIFTIVSNTITTILHGDKRRPFLEKMCKQYNNAK